MSSFPGYKSAYDEFYRRADKNPTHQLIRQLQTDPNLSSFKSCLSLGSGCGKLDAHIISSWMPNLESYTAVELNPNLLADCHTNIGQVVAQRPNIHTHFYLGNAETWEGPSEQVDIIIVSHVLYYFKDARNFLKRCRSWLRDGGYLLMIHEKTEELFEHVTTYFPSMKIVQGQGAQPADIVRSMNFTMVIEFGTKETINLANPSRELVSFFVYRDATDEDMSVFRTLLKNEYESKGSVYVADIDVFLCKK